MKYILASCLVLSVFTSACTKSPGGSVYKAATTLCEIKTTDKDDAAMGKAANFIKDISKTCKEIGVIEEVPTGEEKLQEYAFATIMIRGLLGSDENCIKEVEKDKERSEKNGLEYAKKTCETIFGKAKKKS